MPMSNMPGHSPGTTGETSTSDGQDMGAPADMSGTCEEAMNAATSQREAEAGKVQMGM
jgi:hypothetical protein